MSAEKDPQQPRGVLALRALAMPKDTNPSGDVFGGWIMAQMDIAGGMMAKEIARGRVATVTVDKMVFKLPVRVGDTIAIYAERLRVGNSSIDVGLQVWAKSLPGKFAANRHLVTEGIFRYVAIDAHGRPRKVPRNSLFVGKPGEDGYPR